jgi:hypothetical protein
MTDEKEALADLRNAQAGLAVGEDVESLRRAIAYIEEASK